jgi:hypothetical protein
MKLEHCFDALYDTNSHMTSIWDALDTLSVAGVNDAAHYRALLAPLAEHLKGMIAQNLDAIHALEQLTEEQKP